MSGPGSAKWISSPTAAAARRASTSARSASWILLPPGSSPKRSGARRSIGWAGAIHHVWERLPVPLRGLDSDNGSEFINHGLWDWCQRHQITFTRSRAWKKNDSAHVEQKNGAVVRNLVRYDRFASQAAHAQLRRVYELARLHVNFFQPVEKLVTKRRHGARAHRVYDRGPDAVPTPLRRGRLVRGYARRPRGPLASSQSAPVAAWSRSGSRTPGDLAVDRQRPGLDRLDLADELLRGIALSIRYGAAAVRAGRLCRNRRRDPPPARGAGGRARSGEAEDTLTLADLGQVAQALDQVIIALDKAEDECDCDWSCWLCSIVGGLFVAGVVVAALLAISFALSASGGTAAIIVACLLAGASGGVAGAAGMAYALMTYETFTCENVGTVGRQMKATRAGLRAAIADNGAELNHALMRRDILIASINTLSQ